MTRFYDVRDPETALEFSEFGNFSCFLFCGKGSGGVLVNNRIYSLEEKALCIIPPFSSLMFVRMSDDMQGWIIKMDMKDIADAVLGMPMDMVVDIRKDACRVITDKCSGRIVGMKRLMEDRLSSSGEEDYFMAGNVIASLNKAFCYEVVQAFVVGRELESVHNERKYRIFNLFLESVKLRFASEKRVAYYAVEQNLSPAYFSDVIKEVSGRSAKFWIESLTFASAVKYLRNPNFPIREVAWLLNFPDQSSFGKFFKNISGLSPADYRKRYLK